MLYLLKELTLGLLAKAFMDSLDERLKAIVMAENADVYSHVLEIEQCVTILGERVTRMQEGLRLLGCDGVPEKKT